MTPRLFRRRMTALATVGLLAFSGIGAIVPAHAAGQQVDVTWSSEDGAYALTDTSPLSLDTGPAAPADVAITVDPAAHYQSIFGQGPMLDSTSVWNIAHLSPDKRDEIMRQLFDPTSGNGYDVVRLGMGCPDMCSEAFYTYDDMPDGQTDESLAHFSIAKDVSAGIVSVAQQALRINPNVRFYMSMWSAPAWMKTNASLINGGSVKPQYYDELARYQVKAIQAYQALGIPIHAMTPQNEPRVVYSYPTGEWTGEQMRDYIRDHLGPALWDARVGTQIWVGDDNPPRLRDFVPVILDDPAARQYVRGVAIHDYSGDDPAVLSEFRLRYPDMPIHLTERTYYGINGEVHKYTGDVQKGVRRVMDFYRNGLQSWTYWITFLDKQGGPSTGPLKADCCAVPFLADAGDLDGYTTNRDYYLYGQFSRFVDRGAVRIGSDQTSTEVSNVAFRNPDGEVVVVVANGAGGPRSVSISSPDGSITQTIPALTVATFRWAGSATQSDPRVGTFRLVNRANPDRALQKTGDGYPGNTEASNIVGSPLAWNRLDQRWVISSAGAGSYRLTSASSPSRVLHATGDLYGGWTDVWNVAATPGAWRWDEQRWQLQPTGDGYYRVIDAKRGTALQLTQDVYWSDALKVVASPSSWLTAEQQWRLVPD